MARRRRGGYRGGRRGGLGKIFFWTTGVGILLLLWINWGAIRAKMNSINVTGGTTA